MFCSSCGKAVTEGANFCQHCGARISLPSTSSDIGKEQGQSDFILLKCPSCSASLKVKGEYAGKKGRCKKCNTVFGVPQWVEADRQSDTSPDNQIHDYLSLVEKDTVASREAEDNASPPRQKQCWHCGASAPMDVEVCPKCKNALPSREAAEQVFELSKAKRTRYSAETGSFASGQKMRGNPPGEGGAEKIPASDTKQKGTGLNQEVNPGVLLLILLAIIGGFWLAHNWNDLVGNSVERQNASQPSVEQSSVPQSNPSDSNEPKLEVLSWNTRYEYEHAITEGEVRNVSSESLKNVLCIVTFYTADRQLITSNDLTLIDYNPILPGQTSPFKVITTYNPAMSKVAIRFKTLMGGAIPFRSSE